MHRFRMFVAAALFSSSLMSGAAGQTLVAGVYHRQGCPHADPSRMVLMPRPEAEARGFVPAADCYRTARPAPVATTHAWKYLGESAPAEVSQGAKTVHVREYTREDGTVVRAYDRRAPRREPEPGRAAAP